LLPLAFAPVLALALPLVSAGTAHADNTPGGGDCGGGAPAITQLVHQPGPGTSQFPVLVVQVAQAGPNGASTFVQTVHATICGVGPNS
jgi:hypothetical protein